MANPMRSAIFRPSAPARRAPAALALRRRLRLPVQGLRIVPRQPADDDRPLRICLISETMITGVGRHLVDVAKAMVARGHEVHLLHSSERVEPRLVRELATLPRVTRRALPIRREPHWSDPAVLAAMASHLWRHGPFDVIHGHSSKGGVHARLLGLLFGGLRLYTPHCFATLQPTLPPLRRRLYATVERGLGLATDGVICVTAEERQHALDLGIAARRLTVIPNGLADFDISHGRELRARLALPADAVVVGFIGRMDHQKAPQRLIDACPALLARHPNVHVVMVGEGPLRAGLEARTRQLGCAGQFSWCGDVSGRAWLAGFDMLAMPSVYEGFSYVLLEALYAGVPVVCTPVGGVGDAFSDGVEGFVVPHGDAAVLAERLGRLAGDPDLRQAMGRRARERSAAFTLERMINRLEAAYRSSRGSRGAAGVACSGA